MKDDRNILKSKDSTEPAGVGDTGLDRAIETQLQIIQTGFENDTKALSEYAEKFLVQCCPAYTISNQDALQLEREDHKNLYENFTFYRVCECTVDRAHFQGRQGGQDRFAYFAEKMQDFFKAAYFLNQKVCYGIVSNGGETSLVLGIERDSQSYSKNKESIRVMIEGMIPGIRLEDKFDNALFNTQTQPGHTGCICGAPALKLNGQYREKDLSAMMRSLNGQDYVLLTVCKPVDLKEIQAQIDAVAEIQNLCTAISKRNVSLQYGRSDGKSHVDTETETDSTSKSKNTGVSTTAAPVLLPVGSGLGYMLMNTDWGGKWAGALKNLVTQTAKTIGISGGFFNNVSPLIGVAGGGLLFLAISRHFSLNRNKSQSHSRSISKGCSDAIMNTVNQNQSIAFEVQNAMAMDLAGMAKSVIERLKAGRNMGLWETVTVWSSDGSLASNIIQGTLSNAIASGQPDQLPPVVFSSDFIPGANNTRQLMIPKGFLHGYNEKNPIANALTSTLTSEELCAICTIPSDNTVGFEIKESRDYALNYVASSDDKPLGQICEFDRPLGKVTFGLSEADLNKHTFVCGITGSGKTNTVKQILMQLDKPFMVIEPAKREYRNLERDVDIYTLGRPEINCPRINPFYIQRGVSPQQHIDLLKDLFSASFGFYGPMPYIFETCLYNIYKNKGWNLTLGFHPALVNIDEPEDMFENDFLNRRYSLKAHKYLFPTMQDLKDEIERYLERETSYKGELKGNIESALKARINSLCVGSKGYIFNTHETENFAGLLEYNSVMELEGLADDSDKSFALGLLIININEYRQVQNALNPARGLRHVLVIEEAHRLLKNVVTESSNDTVDLGNPKGKAVEHFTNLLAEMRAYGQGVIVAEQIPSKLAPDVMKNSSNKIVHRIVARDDQRTMANMIGVAENDAIYLGQHKTGYALCHKEGMSQPVIVKVYRTGSDELDERELFRENLSEKLENIVKGTFRNDARFSLKLLATRVLVTLFYDPNPKRFSEALGKICRDLRRKIRKVAPDALLPGTDAVKCILGCIADWIIELLTCDDFNNLPNLPSNKLIQLIRQAVLTPTEATLTSLSKELQDFYYDSPRDKAVEIIANQCRSNCEEDEDITALLASFMLYESDFAEAVKAELAEND